MDEKVRASDGGRQPADTPSEGCQEKNRLLEIWQRAAQAHANAVTALRQSIGTSTKVEYEALYRAVEALRNQVEDAQDRVDRHILKHGC
jgi:Zn finger protein HypA/HybF involved in hydrogenase expression